MRKILKQMGKSLLALCMLSILIPANETIKAADEIPTEEGIEVKGYTSDGETEVNLNELVTGNSYRLVFMKDGKPIEWNNTYGLSNVSTILTIDAEAELAEFLSFDDILRDNQYLSVTVLKPSDAPITTGFSIKASDGYSTTKKQIVKGNFTIASQKLVDSWSLKLADLKDGETESSLKVSEKHQVKVVGPNSSFVNSYKFQWKLANETAKFTDSYGDDITDEKNIRESTYFKSLEEGTNNISVRVVISTNGTTYEEDLTPLTVGYQGYYPMDRSIDIEGDNKALQTNKEAILTALAGAEKHKVTINYDVTTMNEDIMLDQDIFAAAKQYKVSKLTINFNAADGKYRYESYIYGEKKPVNLGFEMKMRRGGFSLTFRDTTNYDFNSDYINVYIGDSFPGTTGFKLSGNMGTFGASGVPDDKYVGVPLRKDTVMSMGIENGSGNPNAPEEETPTPPTETPTPTPPATTETKPSETKPAGNQSTQTTIKDTAQQSNPMAIYSICFLAAAGIYATSKKGREQLAFTVFLGKQFYNDFIKK